MHVWHTRSAGWCRRAIAILCAAAALSLSLAAPASAQQVKDPETYCGPTGYIYVGGGQYAYMAYSHTTWGGQYIYRVYYVYYYYGGILRKSYRTVNRCG
jgi:hypothetical protein